MSVMRPFTVAALALAVATPAVAEQSTQYIYINPFVAFQYFDDKRELSESGTFGGGLEYRFTDRWAAEAVYSRANADRKGAPGDSDFDELRLDGLYYLADADQTWNPYLAFGAGHADFGDNGPNGTLGSNHDETRVNLGGGVRYNVNDTVSLRGDLREFHGIDNSTFDTQVSLGISFAFGRLVGSPDPKDTDLDGITDDRDQCPGTPRGATVDGYGCELDDDNDGVVNSQDQCPSTPAGARVDNQGCELDSDGDGVVDSQDQCPDTTAGAEVDEVGCEGVAETVQTVELRVQFPNNSSVIDHTFDPEIRKVADFMAANPETTVEIAGHTDSSGAANYNQFLSQRRAEAVANRLTESLGVDPARVSAVGYGESQPIMDNDTPEGRAGNRRVEARIQVMR